MAVFCIHGTLATLLETIAKFRVDAIVLVVLAEKAERWAVKFVSADQYSPVTLEIPAQAWASQPI